MGCRLQSQLPQVSSLRDQEAVPSLLRRASGRAPRPRRGAAGAGRGRAREREVGDPEGEEQERGLSATFLQTTLPHAESTEILGALEGIAN